MAKKMKKKKATSRRSSGGTSSIDQMFAAGEPAEGFFNLPGNKVYDGFIKPESAIIELKVRGGDDYRARYTAVVTSPEEFKDKEQVARFDLSTQIGVNIFLGELETLELGKPGSLREAAEMLPEMDNVPIRFWVSEPRDENPPKVRINERLEEGNRGKDEDEDEEEEEVEYTKKQIKAMSDKELDELADECGLDPDDYETYPELAEALIEELEL